MPENRATISQDNASVSDEPKPEEQTFETPPVIERESKVTADLVGCRQPDGSYIYNKLTEDITCHICERPFLHHSREQLKSNSDELSQDFRRTSASVNRPPDQAHK